MKKNYPQIFKFVMFLIVINFGFANANPNNTISTSQQPVASYDVTFDYKIHIGRLNVIKFTASYLTFSNTLLLKSKDIPSIALFADYPGIVGCPNNLGPINTDPGTCGAMVTYVPPTSNIPVGTMELIAGLAPGSIFPVGITTVSYQEHISGVPTANICTFQVTVVDNEDPITPVLAPITIDCNGTLTAPTTTDAWAGTITGTTSDTLAFVEGGSTIINWTFDDGNGNSISVPQTYNYDDSAAPVPNVATLPNLIHQCIASPIPPRATDNCGGLIIGTTTDPTDYTSQGTYTILWTFDDNNGNISTQTQTLIIDDTVAPVPNVNPLPAITAECSVTLTAPRASDNCSGQITGTTSSPITYNSEGSYTVVWTYDDNKGNITTQTQTVIIDDTVAPVPNVSTLPIITGQCSATVTAPIATDNCSGQIIGTTSNPTTYSVQGTYTITWTYNDTNGNLSTQTQMVIIDDIIAPVPNLNALPTINSQCSATLTAPTALDNCSGQVTGTTSNPTSYDTEGTYNVVWTYNDGNGNTSTQTQTVIINDTIAPVPNVSSLPTITGQCSATVTAPTATDNCVGVITATTANPTSYSAQGTYTITWIYNDNNGNISTQIQTVIVDDTIAPVPNVSTLPTINGQCSATVTAPTATDNCSGVVTATTSNPTSYSSQGTYTITWTYNDTNGNISTQTQTVIVDDTIAPVPNVASLPNLIHQCISSPVPPRATDNCGGLIIGTTTSPTSYTVQGTYYIIWTYNDNNGNISTQTQTLVIDDTVAPVPNVSSLPTITEQCSVTLTAPRATDNCKGQITGTTSNPTTYNSEGTYNVVWTYNDTNGNITTQTQTVIINDTVAPVPNILYLPEIVGECSVSVTAPIATDNCRGTMTATTLDPTSYSSLGTHTINWTFNDNNGNITTQVQTVIVEDTIDPVIPTLPDLQAECSLTVTPPTTTDNCNATITGTTGLTSLTFDTVGSDIIYWQFTDLAGNSVVVPQNITITDQSPVPNVSVLNPQTFNGCQITDINFLTAPTATDTCDGIITGTLNSSFVFPFSFSGTQTIDWEFVDSSGNITIQPQDITLNPITVEGGTLNGTFLSTVFSNGIDISSCAEAINVNLNLSGQIGTIIRWEKYAVNQGVWQVIPNTNNSYTASFGVGALVSTYYRVLVQTGTCSAYSNQFFIRALPVGSPPTITNLDPDAMYCLGEDVSLLATSNYTATQEAIPDSTGDFNQGQLNTQDPDGWLVDGDPGGFTAGGSATKPRNWSAKTCNNQANGNIVYCSNDGKYTIAYGNFSSNQYNGAIPTTLETPIMDLSNAQTASLDFDQAYYFATNDYARIEISTNGGNTYSNLRLMHAPGTPAINWFTAGTAESVAGSDATHYNFETDNTSIDLSAYLGQSNVRIRWSFTGTTNQSAWAMDNIFVDKMVVVDTELEWTDGIGDPDQPPIADGTTEVAFVFTPDAPGHHQYGTTALVNDCRTYEEDGTALIDIFVSHAYAGENIAFTSQQCGQNTVQLNAYDNTKTATQNAAKGAFTIPANCVNCDDEGTGEIGVWSIASNSTCGGGTFTDINDPDAFFTAEAGTYTLTWTVAGCSSSITVTTTNCNQIDFDGTNDYVDFDTNNFHFDSGSFSIETWVKPEAISGNQTIFSKRNGNGNHPGYDLSINGSGIVSFNINTSGTINSAPYGITTSRWYHIALTYSGGQYKLYIDGVLIKVTASNAPSVNTYRAILGAMDDNTNNGPQKHFNGWIDEFRVWNKGLTEEQVRLMMNQKLIPSPTVAGNVQGEILPIDIPDVLWSNLIAYFQMEPAQVACGYLESTSSTIKGKLKNISTSETQTAPIPYTSAINGLWNNDTTWTYPNVWDAPNSLGIDGTTRIDWNIVRTNHNIISNARDITLLGLLVDSNKLTITGTGTQNQNNSGRGLWLTHYLKINGTIDLIGESQLVQKRYNTSQIGESLLASNSTGFIERDQQGTTNRWNYNYWSSPVTLQGAPNNSNYTVAGVLRDGTNSSNPLNLLWTTGQNSNGSTTPITMSSRWLYSYQNFPQNSYSDWVDLDQNSPLKVGLGFTMKGSGAASSVQNYVFVGKPNNGTIINTVSPNFQTLIGNPYPSALNANEFIKDNIPGPAKNPGSTESIDGTLYFWEHYISNVTHVLEDYEGGYSAYNLIGGVTTVIPDGISGAGLSTKTPGQFIPVAQSFFVTASPTGGNIAFHNRQRSFVREAPGSSVFFRQSNPNVSSDMEDNPDVIQRLRLEFSSVDGLIRPLLLGFTLDDSATDGFDYGYDALFTDNFPNDMFWDIDGENYIIQGVGTFDDTKMYPLNVTITNEGIVNISLTDLENFDSEINVFLYDSYLNSYTQINTSNFEIMLEAGNYTNRFYIAFSADDALSIDENDNNPSMQVNYLTGPRDIYIKGAVFSDVKKVHLINILGQSIMSWNNNDFDSNGTDIRIPVKDISEGTYIIRVEKQDSTINRKVIIKY